MLLRHMPSAPVLACIVLWACGTCVVYAAEADVSRKRDGQVDYSRLTLKGNGHAQDSFSLALQAAARLLGREAEYETIYCLSTNAFAPAIDLGEDCTAWWHVSAHLATQDIGTVCSYIGLDARRLPLTNFSGDADGEAWAQYQRESAAVARDALERGEVVLTPGGWAARQEHGFVPWCYAGIITQVNEDGSTLGACLNGRQDNVCHHLVPGGTFALSAAEATLAQEQADLTMLHSATLRIRGEGPFARTERAVYGVDAMDAWITKMEQLPFCVPCFDAAPDQVWTCAMDNSVTTSAGASAASRYLRNRVASFPEQARAHLAQASERFERIVELLTPSMTPDSGMHCRDFIGDQQKQTTYVETVLWPVKQELAAAADAMTEALLATYPNEALLDDVPAGRGNCNSYASGLSTLLMHTGSQTDYHTIMGDSGQAFIIQVEQGRPIIDDAVDVGWWPLAGWGLSMRLDFLGQIAGRRLRKLGGSIEAYMADPGAQYRELFELEMKTAIAAHRPVLAEHAPWFVVTGYDDDQQPPLLGRCALSDQVRSIQMSDYPWGMLVLGDEVPQLAREQADADALRHAVALSNDSATPPDGCFTGQRSYALWAAALRDIEHLGQARWHANMCMHLGINRRSAVNYLQEMANRHPESVAAHLNAAVAVYNQLLEQLKSADTSQEAMLSSGGRENLATLVEQLAELDDEAAVVLGKALAE